MGATIRTEAWAECDHVTKKKGGDEKCPVSNSVPGAKSVRSAVEYLVDHHGWGVVDEELFCSEHIGKHLPS